MTKPMPADKMTTMSEWRSWLVALGAVLLGFVLLSRLVDQSSLVVGEEPWLTMWLELAVLITGGLLLCLWALPWVTGDTIKFTLATGLISLLFAGIVLVTLQGTPYTLDALSGDQGLYTAYVTKFAAYAGNVDAVYRDLPAFYPPLYFYLLGRLADWLQVEPYRMLKFGLLGSTLIMPFLLSWSWRRLLPLPFAAAAAFTLLVEQQWYKPAEWLTMVLFVPWWLDWVENCAERTFQGWRQWLLWWFVGGLIGALLFLGYYYWFFIGAISLLMQLVYGLSRAAARKQRWRLLQRAVPMLAGAALFSAIYWGPYLVSMVQRGGWQVLQNRWVAAGKLLLPLPFAEDRFGALALLIGVLYLVLMARHNRVMRSLLFFLVAVYGWLLIGYVGMLTDMPLVSFRAYPLATYIPALGLAFAVAELWQQRTNVVALANRHLSVAQVTAALAIVLVLFFAQNTVVGWLKNEDVPKAVAMTYPATQLTALDDAVGSDYRHKTILLSRDYADWIAYRPFYAFLAWSAHYSHPAAHFAARLNFLERLTTVHSPELFAAALFHNRYDRIDHLLLHEGNSGWEMRFLVDNFPDRNRERTLTFATNMLLLPYFSATAAEDLTVLTPRYQADPVSEMGSSDLGSIQWAELPLTNTVTIYGLVAAFSEHLSATQLPAWQENAASQLQNTDLTMLSTEQLLDLYQFAAEPLRSMAYKTLAADFTGEFGALLTDQNGAPKLQVLGYRLYTVTGAQPPRVTLYLEVLDKLDWDYTVWVHAFHRGEKLNLDFVPPQPSTAWLPGQVLALNQELPAEAGAYEVQWGLWRSAEDVRLVLPAGDYGLAFTYELPAD